ncbi:MAG: response regulator [Gemmatimonadaceae bacterium]|nr:response regulator [Gemmatimonadaceae bacterium]
MRSLAPTVPSHPDRELALPGYLAATYALFTLIQGVSLAVTAQIGQRTGLSPAAAVGLVMILGAPTGGRSLVAITTLLANATAYWLVPDAQAAPPLVGMGVRLLGDWGGALLVLRVIRERPSFERASWLVRFGGLIALVITPTVSVVAAVLLQLNHGGSLWTEFVHWYVPEVIMILTVGPAIWVLRDAVIRARRTPASEIAYGGAVLTILIVAATIAVQQPNVAGITPPISLAVVPLMLYIGYRFGVGTTAWAGVIVMVLLIGFTADGIGPFAATRAAGIPRFVAVELYVGALAIPLVGFAAVLQELRESSQRFQSFLDTTTTPVVAVDLSRRVVGFSPSADQMFRASSGVGLRSGLDPLEAVQESPDVLERRTRGWTNALAGEVHVAVLEPNAETRVEMRYEPMRNSQGDVVGAVASATDLIQQEREAAERERVSRLETIGRVAGGIVHDVNNLMTVILGQVFALRRLTRGSDAARGAFDEIELTVERTKRLSAQLLAFSRAQPIEPIVTELQSEARRTLDMLRRVLQEDAVLTTDFADGDWRIAVDRGQFEQLLLNLVTNARDAMPNGGTVRLASYRETFAAAAGARLGIPAGDYVRLDISDEGAGIPVEVISNIFDPFYTTKGAQGNGLGLATVKAIMQKAGGAVSVASAPGLGTTFSMWFPRTTLPLTVAAAETIASSWTPDVPSSHAIVCEDEPAIRRVVARTLGSAGWQVTECATAEDALTQLSRADAAYSLLITDVVMPGMSGIDLMRAARQRQPTIAIMLMTGYSEEIVHSVEVNDRPDVVLAKPFRGEDLIREAQRLLAS